MSTEPIMFVKRFLPRLLVVLSIVAGPNFVFAQELPPTPAPAAAAPKPAAAVKPPAAAPKPAAAVKPAAPARNDRSGKYDSIKILSAWVPKVDAKQNRAVQKSIRETARDVDKMTKGALPLSDPTNKRKFDAYFNKYIFARMTDPSLAGQYAAMRRKFFRDSIVRARPDVHAYIVGLTLRYMTSVAQSKRLLFSPASRYNAMLIIGLLNEQEATGIGSKRQPPKPYLSALDTMLKEFRNPQQIDEVRVACLVGIHRHALLDAALAMSGQGRLSRDRTRDLLTEMQGLAAAATPPPGRTLEGHNWMRRRAIDVIGALGMVNSAGETAQMLDRIVTDAKAPISLRCTAALAIGRLKFTAAEGYDAAKAAKQIGQIAAIACRNELSHWEQQIKRQEEREKRKATGGGVQSQMAGGMTGMGGMAGMGALGGGGDEGMDYGAMLGGSVDEDEDEEVKEDFHITASRRRLKYQFTCVMKALMGPDSLVKPRPGVTLRPGGVYARATKKQKAEVKKVAAAIRKLFTITDQKVEERDAFLKSLEENLQPVEIATRIAPPAPAIPAPGDQPDAPDQPDTPAASAPAAG